MLGLELTVKETEKQKEKHSRDRRKEELGSRAGEPGQTGVRREGRGGLKRHDGQLW